MLNWLSRLINEGHNKRSLLTKAEEKKMKELAESEIGDIKPIYIYQQTPNGVKVLNEKETKYVVGFDPYKKIIEGRRVGNTTRLVDAYIQKLFLDGKITHITDHYYTSEAHSRLYDLVVRRLKTEHPYSKFSMDSITRTIIYLDHKPKL